MHQGLVEIRISLIYEKDMARMSHANIFNFPFIKTPVNNLSNSVTIIDAAAHTQKLSLPLYPY